VNAQQMEKLAGTALPPRIARYRLDRTKAGKGWDVSSIKTVTAEIERFLRCKEPQVLCITGDWGVGKTYTWNELIKSAADSGELSRGKYSYVSLFGLNSLAEVKFAIAENLQILHSDDLQPVTDAKNAVLSSIKYLKGFVSVIPYVGKAISDSGNLLFSSIVNDQIVCIDDLDRRGAGIRIEDVLGLVTSLRDERQCSVVLLLNEEQLDGKDIFDRHFEKVIDSRLVFAPTATEAVQHGIKGTDDVSKQIATNCILLGISNIRVIKKIERLVRSIEPLIENRSAEIKTQTLHSLTILGWTKYQPDLAPPFEFYAENPFSRIMKSDKEEMSDEEVSWTAITDRYKFEYLDDYDAELLEYVKNGVADHEAIKEAAERQDAEVAKREAHAAIKSGFSLFHASFADNVDDVARSIRQALQDQYRYVSLGTLHASVLMLKDMERNEDALALIKFFEMNHEPEFWEPEDDPFGGPEDPDVRAAMLANKATIVEEFNLARELVDASRSLNSVAIERIASRITADDLYTLLKAGENESMRRIVHAGLGFAKYGSADKDVVKIVSATKQALGMIARESKLNAARVKKFGINLENQKPEKKEGPDAE
jgi:hypothetical protein